MSDDSAPWTGRLPIETRRSAPLDWPTLLLFVGVFASIGGALMLPSSLWIITWPVLVIALVLQSSLTHEMLHGRPFGRGLSSTVMGLVQPGLFIPYLRFKRLHLAHHRDERLTDPYDDPETGYLDPDVWVKMSPFQQRLMAFNNTLLGRMVLGPALGQWAMCRDDLALIRAGNRQVAWDWLLHVPGTIVVIWLVMLSPMPLWAYVLACYAAISVLKIRTYLEHQAHVETAGRTVIIEDRGVLACLFLNNNFHLVHHMHPEVAWYRLPAVYGVQKDDYCTRNEGYVYRSYRQVFSQFMFRAKEPVAHPLWQGPRK